MTILNTANDGLPNILIVAYKTLLTFGPMTSNNLVSLCAPGVVNPKRIRDTLNRWSELELFVEANEKIEIDKQHLLSDSETHNNFPAALAKRVRNIALASKNNKNFWGSKESRSADFTRGLAWLLAQDVYTLNTSSHQAIQELEHGQINDSERCIVNNDVRWGGLQSWAVFLGFGWQSPSLVVDPTVAIRDTLPEVFTESATLSVEDFVRRLAKAMPVLDFGEYRKKVEDILEAASWSKPQDRWLSTSLSRALKRLEVEGALRLERRADVESVYVLTGCNRREWDRCTHVSLNTGA